MQTIEKELVVYCTAILVRAIGYKLNEMSLEL
jgi:hypothetical protein